MKRKPSEYLRGPQLYFDSLVYSPQNLRNVVTAAGASQVVIGTDFGFPIASMTPVDTVLQTRSEEHTSELQSRPHLVCRLLLEKKKKKRSLLFAGWSALVVMALNA